MSITKIAEVTVGSGGAASIDFTSISGSFTDLMVVVSSRKNAAADGDALIKFNGSSSSYSSRALFGSGSSAFSGSSTTAGAYGGLTNQSNYTASTFANTTIYIPNYAGATNKSWSVDSVQETNATASYQQIAAGLWSNTAAITSIALTDVGGAGWLQYTSAILYGITKGSSSGVTVA